MLIFPVDVESFCSSSHLHSSLFRWRTAQRSAGLGKPRPLLLSVQFLAQSVKRKPSAMKKVINENNMEIKSCLHKLTFAAGFVRFTFQARTFRLSRINRRVYWECGRWRLEAINKRLDILNCFPDPDVQQSAFPTTHCCTGFASPPKDGVPKVEALSLWLSASLPLLPGESALTSQFFWLAKAMW